MLTTYLLLKFGYPYVPYVSLEAIIEQNKQRYYLALRQTQGTLRNPNPDWQSWTLFFLKALLKQKQRSSNTLAEEYLLLGKLPRLSLKIIELIKARGHMTISEITTLTQANQNTVKRHLEKLTKSGQLQKHGNTKETFFTR